MLCHWVSEASQCFYLQAQAFLDFSTLAEESTTILHNAGNYLPTDSVKFQNESNSNYKLRYVTSQTALTFLINAALCTVSLVLIQQVR